MNFQVTMCCEHYNMSDGWTFALENCNVFFIVVFTAEMLLKMFALRQYYFTVSWNNFDFVVVMLSLMSLFLEDLMARYSPVSPTLLRVVRIWSTNFAKLKKNLWQYQVIWIQIYCNFRFGWLKLVEFCVLSRAQRAFGHYCSHLSWPSQLLWIFVFFFS